MCMWWLSHCIFKAFKTIMLKLELLNECHFLKEEVPFLSMFCALFAEILKYIGKGTIIHVMP